jgi:transcription-repair coupling factor (superfamily II helicase)
MCVVSSALTKSIPKPGNRFALPALHGSADAYALAQIALDLKSRGQMLAIVVASASDAQRLLDEIPWFGGDQLRCHLLPDWETLPYDAFSPHQDLVSERLATLHEITSGQCDVMLVPATTALVRMAPPSFLAAYTFFFKQGESLDEAQLKSQLTLAGYTHVTQVMSPGEYSVRGGLIDLFPMGSALPYRLDLFGDTIETIRTFDADTQRSLYPVQEVRLLPGREFPMDEAARTAFRSRWREHFEGDPSRAVIYKDIGAASPRPASSTTCRCSSSRPPRCSSTCRKARWWPPWAISKPPSSASGPIPSRYRFIKADRERPICRRKSCSCRRTVLRAGQAVSARHPQERCRRLRAVGAGAGYRRQPPSTIR